MEFTNSIDPFLFQLVLLPIVVIGIGIAVSLITGKIFIGPLVTLLLNLAYETWYFSSYGFSGGIYYSPWNLILPAVSLVFCWIVVSVRKQIINVRQADV
ncbi:MULTISPECIES: hypothetical protein [Planococcus]|uniref:hypothetical protein n=1 Tax=Planococcus TaxID=1372 RepID=UPI001FEF2FB4|nr:MULTISPECIES: hypothetical protein [Planococcus]MCJ1907684.1 hypothetical protein [Planococcus ruber]GKW45950.1 hypothetical protein NCCP2050_16420 [Planococcus sp. NCCP-2050]